MMLKNQIARPGRGNDYFSQIHFCSGLHKNAAKYPLTKVEVAAFMVILQLSVLYELLGKEFLIIRNNPNNKTA